MSPAIEIFCCYAREDQRLLRGLKNQLMPLQWQGRIRLWSDTDLNAGEEWGEVLHQHLESADIILLLISPDFMASEYCYSIEMKRAMQCHEEGSACVIPIMLRPVHVEGALFAKLQMLPENAKPITRWSHEDDAFYNIAEQINVQDAGSTNGTYLNNYLAREALPAYTEILFRLVFFASS